MAVMAKPKPHEVKAALTQLSNASRLDLDKVFLNVLDEMMILFYPPFRASTDDELLEQASIGAKAYVEDLAEFRVETLADAWRQVRREHKTERWPTIQTIRDACLTASGGRGPRRSNVVCMLSPEVQDKWRQRFYRAPDTVPRDMQKILGLGEFA